jgi:hypothetical protein
MTKRIRSDSVTAAVKAMVSVSLPEIDPPKHAKLRDQDKPFWSDIIKSRARDEWAQTDLVVAVHLARCQSDMEKEAEALDAEGSVIENQRGTPIMNPRHSVMEQLARRELALMRTLGLTGFTAKSNQRDVAQARKMQRQAEKTKQELEDEDLLAS